MQCKNYWNRSRFEWVIITLCSYLHRRLFVLVDQMKRRSCQRMLVNWRITTSPFGSRSSVLLPLICWIVSRSTNHSWSHCSSICDWSSSVRYEPITVVLLHLLLVGLHYHQPVIAQVATAVLVVNQLSVCSVLCWTLCFWTRLSMVCHVLYGP